MLNKKQLKEYIITRHDPDEVVEILGLSTEDLLIYLIDVCHKKQHLFVDEEDIWTEP
jgi:hypothetical protein